MDDQSNVLLRASQPAPLRTSRTATASFVFAALSLAGLVSGPWVNGAEYGFLCFIPAIVAGHLARHAFGKSPGAYRNEGMATFGLAIGYFGLFVSIVVISAMIFGVVTFTSVG